MPAIAPQATIDPLGALIAGAFTSETKRPIPLLSTSFDVSVDSGLATVTTKRLFRNDEPNSIEATITFPVPVHATLFALEARIGGRILKAHAQRQELARETYEGAVERGKATVLHEEVLRGVHMLSVGHIPPGAEVEVSTIWAATLTVVGDRAFLRIPLTVGDIYGRSSLPDSDALIHIGSIQTAELVVHCSDGAVELVGGHLDQGRTLVPLNAPIDLAIADWISRDLRGRAADAGASPRSSAGGLAARRNG
jgi:Vault protein inter-alpha-trypsin domain